MRALGVHHVALNVVDIDDAVGFYTGVLGFEVIDRPDFGFPGAWLQAGAQQVHLAPIAEQGSDSFQHFALQVADIDAAIADIRTAGWKVDPVPHMAGAGHQAFLRDPSGNLIELNQPE